ncbi:MAG: 3-ketoacyl-ACP reductase, partial [Planctomycetota bacterium]
MIDRRVALVTGGSRGIGRAISIELARSGYAVLINYHTDLGQAEQTRGVIQDAGGTAEICQADVAAPSHRDLLVDFTMETYGRVDMLVNNAGIAPPKRTDILETDIVTFTHVMGTNLVGPYFLSQRVAKVMIDLLGHKQIPRPMIVNISSIRAYTSAWNYGEYCVSKAGLAMVTQLFARRLAEHGINVYEIRPGVIETDMTASKEVRDYYDQFIGKGMTPIDRWGKPEEVASAVGMLARDNLPFSTGEV